MPFILSPLINLNDPGMWGEGPSYQRKNIFSIESGKLPPVNYDEHILRPHSLTHIETAAHTQKHGHTVDYYFKNHLNYFYGSTLVVKLTGDKYKSLGDDIFHWEISEDEIRLALKKYESIPSKILISTEKYYQNPEGYHDPKYVLTLSQAAADYLTALPGFHLYGTSWKSSDYNPGSSARPIHNTLFKNGIVLENLDLKNVPAGEFFMTAFPMPLVGASESMVVPVLFTKDEVRL